ncbi:zinc knuckle CX2CX4HX4C containing protein, partial [Tanacetum coccineum]
MTAKQLEDIHNFKQEGDESLYQAWERYNDLLYKCPAHDINSHQKVNIFYKGLSTMNHKLLDSQGPIPRIRPAEALTPIQTMADHSQKWHDGTTSRNIRSSSSKDGLSDLVNKLDNLGRDMKKLKESVHAIQVGCQIYKGPYLDKDCPLNEKVKQVEEVRYGEFRRTTSFNGSNGGNFHVGPPGYYTKVDNRPPYAERRQSLKELLAKHQEESARRSTEMEEGKSEQAKVVIVENEGPSSPKKLKNLHGIVFLSDSQEENTIYQLPMKESNPGHFMLPCTIDNFNFYAMTDLGASVNVLPRNIFKYLGLRNLSETEMLVEIADMRKKAPLGIVIDKSTEALDPDEDPFGRCLDEYNWVFPKEIEQLANEYEIKIGEKGKVLEEIWTKCKKARSEDKDWWYDYCGKSNETLSLGRKNGSKFRKMIMEEMEETLRDDGEDYVDKTIQKLRGNSRDRLDSYSFGNLAEFAAV